MTVIEQLHALPTDGLTVGLLKTLDRALPGEWSPTNRFEDLVREVLGPDAKPGLVADVTTRAMALQLANPGYGRALQVYALVDKVDTVAAGVAAASQVGNLLGAFGGGFLQKLTPKPDTTQALDAGLKLIAELIAFGLLHGVPSASPEGLARFAGALTDYGRYDLVRVAAWSVFDGLVPLGPDFVSRLIGTWKGLASDQVAGNPVFQQLAGQLPGQSVDEKRAFVIDALDTTGDWVGRFLKEKQLTQEGVLKQLQGTLGVADSGLDVIAAAIDATTSYFAHTGTQTVARTLARHAVDQLRDDVWKQYVAGRG